MTTSHTGVGENNTETLGKLFKSTRLAKQHSIEDAVASTRIHIRIIRALEDDNYENMPAEVFVRGFIKLYAEFLELGPDETLTLYVRQQNTDSDKPDEAPYKKQIRAGESYSGPPLYKKNKRKISIYSLCFAILAGFLVIISLLPDVTEEDKVQNYDQSENKESLSNDDNGVQQLPSPQGPEILVARPPAIRFEEDGVQEEPIFETGGNEPEEHTRVFDRKPYKITKAKGSDAPEKPSSTSETNNPSLPEESTPSSLSIPLATEQTVGISISDMKIDETVLVSKQAENQLPKKVTVSVKKPAPGASSFPVDKPAVGRTNVVNTSGASKTDNIIIATSSATHETKYLLEATFVEPTWMRIKIDEKSPQQYTYQPGMKKTWSADRSISLKIDNGGGVIFSLNGKPLPTGVPSGTGTKITIPDDTP